MSPARVPFWQTIPPRNLRLHPSVYAVTGQAVFFTIRARRETRPFDNPAHAALVMDCMRDQCEKSACTLIAYCVMPDHVHLLVAPARDGASALTCVDRIKGYTAYRFRTSGFKGKLWQPRSYDHVIRTQEALETIAAYILANPVRRGLVEDPDDWPWSGIAGMPQRSADR